MITVTLPNNANNLADAELVKLVRNLINTKSKGGYIVDESFLTEFFSPKSSMFLERLCYRSNITLAQLKELAEDCIYEWIATDKLYHKTYSEASTHLISHLRIKLNNENNRRKDKPNRDSDFGRYIQQQLDNSMPTATCISRQLPTNVQSE